MKPAFERGASTGEAGRPSEESVPRRTGAGFALERHFTRPEIHPYELLQWVPGRATITASTGEVIFEQDGVEFPSSWSQLSKNVVVSKYFKGGLGTPQRERSLKQVIDRVVRALSTWGLEDGYLSSPAQAELFSAELTHLLVNQAAAFNSPVWFNLGIETHPQCSACFINSVEDTMDSILNLAHTEGMLFKFGSGTGTNFSTLRSSRERLSTGGTPSGPVSFMRGFDAFAGVIKSGGRTRRAAKMVILNVDHPDIVDFIRCKQLEEKKARALIAAGYDGSFGGEAYGSVFFQNSNNSVRVTDEFMRAVEADGPWRTRAVTTREPVDELRARELMQMIVEAAHACGDPGLQFDSTVNRWHTCKASGRINASNPCSEYMFLDDSACNLASLNLMRFRRSDGTFDAASFRQAVRIMILAQEIIVDRASYPTERIRANSVRFRPLGLGYANLGALLMSLGLPYDSPEGNRYASAVTALMTAEAYAVSAELAAAVGPFPGHPPNAESMLEVIAMHRDAADRIEADGVPAALLEEARAAWARALERGREHGFRNAQVSVLAPTGTIGFMMDCDTTGVEPDIALVKFKKLVGGGLLKIVNQTVPLALKRLGYPDQKVTEIVAWIEENGSIEGAPGLRPEHLPVFDCAFRPVKGSRSISHMGHLRMMAAVQPFLSGAISKTVNMPEEATAEEIGRVYMEAWRLGLKAVAVYRENSKRVQPLSTSKEAAPVPAPAAEPPKPMRRRLPMERNSLTHKFSINGHEGYLTVGMYDDGAPGEMFVKMSKEGSVVSGLMDAVATMTSIALQYGVPLDVLVGKFAHTRFEPAGMTENPQIRFAKSIMDYLGRWLALKFLPAEKQPRGKGMWHPTESENGHATSAASEEATHVVQEDAPVCGNCGTLMIRCGACYSCYNCGLTSGCS